MRGRGRLDKEEKALIIRRITEDIKQIDEIDEIEFTEGTDYIGILSFKGIKVKIRRQSVDFIKIIKSILTEEIEEHNISTTNNPNPIISNLERIGVSIDIKPIEKIGKHNIVVSYKGYRAEFTNVLQKDVLNVLYILDSVRRKRMQISS